MNDNTTHDKNSIARELGYENFEDAPVVVQNNIKSVLEGPLVEDPFYQLRRGE